ncbi:nitrate/nitrite transporter [Pseudomonas sp. Pseusp122]|uniref:MFS transporter n=1 Tax=unclassified Pseudomonas TaxID=196821 RepID=UPI0039A76BF8
MNAAIVVLLTGLVGATFGFGIYLFAQLVPDMRASLGFDLSWVGAITASGQCGYLAAALLAAWLTPRIGGGRVIFVSGVVCAVALMLIPLTDNILLIGALLTLLAATAATIFVPMVDVVSKVVSWRYRGMAMGLVSSGTSYGVFVNSLLVPVYAPQGEWRMVWWWVGVLTVVMSVMVLWTFKRSGLFGNEVVEPAPVTIAPASFKRLGFLDWIKPWVLIVWGMNFLMGFSTFPFQNYLSSYLRSELGFDVSYTAQIWAAIGFVGMFAGLAVGMLSDRIGLRTTMVLVFISVLLAALIFVFQPAGYWPLVAGVLFSAAFYPIFGLIPAYVSKLATSASMAVAIFAIANVMQGTGGMLGNYGAGLLASHSGSFAGVYGVIGVVAVMLVVLTLMLPGEARHAAVETAQPCTSSL